jgi:hypothetical protein
MVAVLPAQMLGLLTAGLGLERIDIVPIAVAVHPQELVAVTVYVPPAVLVIDLVVSPLLHTYLVPPGHGRVSAVRVTAVPTHTLSKPG